MKTTSIIVTCEHASNEVPGQYLYLFAEDQHILKTHAAYDIGAHHIAEQLSNSLKCNYFEGVVTRLLIDCNRRLTNKSCFSSFSNKLPPETKQELIDKYYLPYRKKVDNKIDKIIKKGSQVLHLSIHSFTPELNGKIRNAAIGLLYDSSRHGEGEVARVLQKLLTLETLDYRVRMNYPYLGSSDGFTTCLRKKYPQKSYLGLEIECNQALIEDTLSFDKLIFTICRSVKELQQYL